MCRVLSLQPLFTLARSFSINFLLLLGSYHEVKRFLKYRAMTLHSNWQQYITYLEKALDQMWRYEANRCD